MTENATSPLKRFESASPFARSRTNKGESSIKVDPMEDAIATAEAMPRLLTPEQVAASLAVTRRTLERWRMTGNGPAYISLTRTTVRYAEQAVAAFLAARVKKNTAQ